MTHHSLAAPISLILLGILSSYNILSFAAEATVATSLGYNSNPLELSKLVPTKNSAYMDSTFSISESFNDRVKLSMEAYSLKHESNFEQADTDHQSANLKLIAWYRYFNKHLVIHSADIGFKRVDKTYFFSDGSTANINGEDIRDRDDSDTYSIHQKNMLKIDNNNRFYLSWFYIGNHYQKYLNVSDNNNTQSGLNTRWKHNLKPNQKTEITLGIDEQKYDHKQDRDKNGVIINNSNLNIKNISSGFKYKIEFQQKFKYWLSLNITKGESEENQYYNYKQSSVFSRVEYKLSPKTTLNLHASFSTLDYPERVGNNSLIDGELTTLSSKAKFLAYIQSHQIYKSEKLNVNTDIFIRIREHTSNLSNYRYKQENVGTSIEFKF